jgi:CBS domain-containing protein
MEFLRRHAPFDRMSASDVEFLARHLTLAYYAKDRPVTSSGAGLATTLYIVQSGLIRGELEAGAPGDDRVEYGEGECFPLAAVMDKRPTVHRYEAASDSFCFEVNAEVVHALAQRSVVFLEFCNSRAGTLLRQSYATLQALYARASTSAAPVNAKLGDLLRRDPLTCAPTAPLREALRRMHEAKVGSIVIVNEGDQPLGIFTERDLVRVASTGQLDFDAPMSGFMTASPWTLPTGAVAAEAALVMAREGIRHIAIVDDARLKGIVSERDLFALQRTSVHGMVAAIDSSADQRALAQCAQDIRAFAGNMLAQGVGAESLTRLISTLNDKVTRRLLSLEHARHGLHDIAFCWIALGSEGREEQTIATDQDNGIIFTDPVGTSPLSSTRQRLLAFADAVNHALDACGYPLCKGNIMAGNPAWCLTLSEWRDKFSSWISDPLPSALLNATIFFDLRPLWGEETLARTLGDLLLDMTRGNLRFARAMAQGALESRPPLGLIADFVTSDVEGAPDSIDLKAQGTRTFVDAARIFSLVAGVAETRTAERLRAAGSHLRIPHEEIEAAVDAFHYLLLYRMRQQQEGAQHPNRVRPGDLNLLERRILKEAFRHARKLQSRLALDYQL